MNANQRIKILKTAAKKKYIIERIEYALHKGIKLTQAAANRWPFFTSRLGGEIYCLRKYHKKKIQTEIIRVTCGDGHIAHVAEYSWVGK